MLQVAYIHTLVVVVHQCKMRSLSLRCLGNLAIMCMPLVILVNVKCPARPIQMSRLKLSQAHLNVT